MATRIAASHVAGRTVSYTSPSETQCPICDAAPGAPCESFNMKTGKFEPKNSYHEGRQQVEKMRGQLELRFVITGMDS